MFAMSADNIEDGLQALSMIPMAVSYEYDPCDMMKTNELMHLKILGAYEKKSGEDFLSMLKGITGHKGRVNISMGNSLKEHIEHMRTYSHTSGAAVERSSSAAASTPSRARSHGSVVTTKQENSRSRLLGEEGGVSYLGV